VAVLRQSIFDAVLARFQTITTGNGYKTNIGNKVFKWREFATITVPEMPCVVIGDTKEDSILVTITRNSAQRRTLTITFSLLATGASPEAIAIELRKALSDIDQAIRSDVKWSNTALMTKPGPNELAFSESPMSDLVGALTGTFDIDYQTEYFNSEQ
jgi:hypothetical protein